MSMWLVMYAIRSEAATIVVVEAENEPSAIERALAVERVRDSFMAPYLERAMEEGGRVVGVPIHDGLAVDIDTAH